MPNPPLSSMATDYSRKIINEMVGWNAVEMAQRLEKSPLNFSIPSTALPPLPRPPARRSTIQIKFLERKHLDSKQGGEPNRRKISARLQRVIDGERGTFETNPRMRKQIGRRTETAGRSEDARHGATRDLHSRGRSSLWGWRRGERGGGGISRNGRKPEMRTV